MNMVTATSTLKHKIIANASPAAPFAAQQSRPYGIAVAFDDGNVDRAFGKLSRLMKEHGVDKQIEKLRNNEYIKPSQKRVMRQTLRERHTKLNDVQEKIRWVMRRKNRGF